MPVTELAFLPSSAPGAEVPPALLREGTAALEAQDQWCAENFTTASTTSTSSSSSTAPTTANPPWYRSNRGAALYRQREPTTGAESGGGAVVLVTAHWASPEQHHAWIASAANREVMGRLVPLVRAEDVMFFHVREVEMFPREGKGGEGEEEETTTLGAPVVSVTRVKVEVEVEGKSVEGFEAGFEKAGGRLGELTGRFGHRGGWRIEKEREGEEEFVIVGGWESEEKAEGWRDGGAKRFFDDEGFGTLVSGVDVKTYSRIL